jgi:hypothetical protein
MDVGWTGLRVGETCYYNVNVEATMYNSGSCWREGFIRMVRITRYGEYIIKFNSGHIERFSNVIVIHDNIRKDKPGRNIITSEWNQKYMIQLYERSPIFTNPPPVGTCVDVLDNDLIWWEASVVRVVSNDIVRVHFDQWGEKWDQDIMIRSGRIAPFRTYTTEWRCQLKVGG